MQRPNETTTPPTAVRVPAEWEPQQCIWLAWPHNRETWPGRFDVIPDFYARWVRLIAESTPVRIIASGDALTQCHATLNSSTHSHQGDVEIVEIVEIATNDCWIRDYGPTFVLDSNKQTLSGINWRYNAWGGKYPPWDCDNAVAPQICRHLGIECQEGPLCLEGGALEFDGRGRLMTNDCLVSTTRNPGSSRESIAAQLHAHLGVNEIVWVDGGGLQGDDTDGHIDQLARFLDEQNVVVAVSDDGDDPNREGLEANYRQLRLWGSETKPKVEVHRLPIPPARFIDGQRVPESYCNFLRLGPARMLVPTFDAPTDAAALALLRELTGGDVTGVDCRDLVWGLGALHCASRDQPAATRG